MDTIDIGGDRPLDLLDLSVLAVPYERHPVDPALGRLEPLWAALDIGAGGLRNAPGAFRTDRLDAVAAGLDVAALLEELRALRLAFQRLRAPVLVSDRLGLVLHRTDLVALFGHLVRTLDPGSAPLDVWLAAGSDRLAARHGGRELLTAGRRLDPAELPDEIARRAGGRACLVFDGVRFGNGLDLSEIEISEPLVFRDCRFEDAVDLSDSRFTANVTLLDCRLPGLFLDGARCVEASGRFDRSPDLVLTARSFRGVLDFAAGLRGAEIDLTGAVIEGDFVRKHGSCGPATFDDVLFVPASPNRNDRLDRYHFGGAVRFDGADLRRLVFDGCSFAGPTLFRRCRLGPPDRCGWSFDGPVAFEDLTFAAEPDAPWSGTLTLDLATAASFERVTFEGRITVVVTAGRLGAEASVRVAFGETRFRGPVRFEIPPGVRVRLAFRGSVFEQAVEFHFPAERGSLDVGGTRFLGPVRMEPSLIAAFGGLDGAAAVDHPVEPIVAPGMRR